MHASYTHTHTHSHLETAQLVAICTLCACVCVCVYVCVYVCFPVYRCTTQVEISVLRELVVICIHVNCMTHYAKKKQPWKFLVTVCDRAQVSHFSGLYLQYRRLLPMETPISSQTARVPAANVLLHHTSTQRHRLLTHLCLNIGNALGD